MLILISLKFYLKKLTDFVAFKKFEGIMPFKQGKNSLMIL